MDNVALLSMNNYDDGHEIDKIKVSVDLEYYFTE